MSSNHKRPAADAYDHLWSLLPVFIVFIAVVMFAAAVDDRRVQDSSATQAEPAPAATAAAAQGGRHPSDPSVPAATAAMNSLADSTMQPIATF
jgi:hypothetical protein